MVVDGVCSTFFAKVRYGKRDDRDVFAAGNKIRLYKVGGPTPPSLTHSLGRVASCSLPASGSDALWPSLPPALVLLPSLSRRWGAAPLPLLPPRRPCCWTALPLPPAALPPRRAGQARREPWR